MRDMSKKCALRLNLVHIFQSLVDPEMCGMLLEAQTIKYQHLEIFESGGSGRRVELNGDARTGDAVAAGGQGIDDRGCGITAAAAPAPAGTRGSDRDRQTGSELSAGQGDQDIAGALRF